MIPSTELLTPEQFSNKLLAAIEGFPCEDTRFYQILTSRKCPRQIVQRYARSTYLSASLFCASIAELVEKAPNDKAKLILLNNLLEEEGIFLRSTKGLVVRPKARHPALAMRFVKACGADKDLDSNPLHATQLGRDYLAQGRWLEAVGFLLVGQELKFAETSGLIMKALLNQGFKEKDLAFFAIHGEADLRHGQEALELVIENSHTPQEQQAALDAAREGARHWFDMHGGMTKKCK